eukprot:scaffold51476_cov54-Phaeocystis_antarctica.AAC.2
MRRGYEAREPWLPPAILMLARATTAPPVFASSTFELRGPLSAQDASLACQIGWNNRVGCRGLASDKGVRGVRAVPLRGVHVESAKGQYEDFILPPKSAFFEGRGETQRTK